MDSTGAGGVGGAAAAPSFDGKLMAWPEDSALNICNVPTDQKAFVRYVATEWFKNQTINNPRSQAQQAINNAQALYGELASRGYMDS